jgi:hypothetical protein
MPSTPRLACLRGAAMLLLMLSLRPGITRAQGPVNHLYDKFQFGVSAATVVLGTTIRIDNADGTRGTDIDLDALGIGQNAFSPSGAVAWRPGRRHELALTYLYVSRSGSKQLERDIDFGDTTFAAGLQVNTSFAAPTLSLAYRFAILAKENVQAGVQIGLGALFFNVGIDAQGTVNGGGGNPLSGSYSASKGLTGPTAALGGFGAFRAGDHWYFNLDGGYIGATVSNISASSWVLGADVRYFFNNHWGLSGGWSYAGVKVSTDTGNDGGWLDLAGSIEYNYNVFRLGAVYALH